MAIFYGDTKFISELMLNTTTQNDQSGDLETDLVDLIDDIMKKCGVPIYELFAYREISKEIDKYEKRIEELEKKLGE